MRIQLIIFMLLRTILNSAHRMVYPFLSVFARGVGVELQTFSLLMTARSLVGALSPFFAPIADRRGRKFGMLMGIAKKELGMEVLERSIDRTEVFIAEEMFMTGTAAQIVDVTKIDHRPVGSGVMGNITTKLRSLFDDVVRAKNPTFNHWNVEVK